MSKRRKAKQESESIPLITGQNGPTGMRLITDIRIGTELGGGILVSILWYTKFRCLLITEHKKEWVILHYVSDTVKKRKFNGLSFHDNLREYKRLNKKNYDLRDLLIKLVYKIKI